MKEVALWLLAAQRLIGALDTFYYHEWRAQLPALGRRAAPELQLHAARDFLYAILFAGLPWLAWHGWWAAALASVLAAEIVSTMADFIVEVDVRSPIGDVFGGERITHAAMGIIYGAMLATLLPTLRDWWTMPTALVRPAELVPLSLRWSLTAMAASAVLSGIRDLYAAAGLPHGNWPWQLPPSAGASS